MKKPALNMNLFETSEKQTNFSKPKLQFVDLFSPALELPFPPRNNVKFDLFKDDI
jgi:hypothetical protein